MSGLRLAADVKVKSFSVVEENDGQRRINAQLSLYAPGGESEVTTINVGCIQPKSDQKAAENYLEAYLVGSGVYTLV